MRILFTCLLISICLQNRAFSQRLSFGNETTGDPGQFYAETKQVNQFFHRFNSEESPRGKRYYEGDSLFRSNSLRRKYIPELFDKANTAISPDLKSGFISEVTYKRRSSFLEFHGGEWFAQATCTFQYRGLEQEAILFLKLEEERIGSKWVMHHVFFQPFHDKGRFPAVPRVSIPYFSGNQPKFLHPMSHELDFMNLRKAFADSRNIFQYVSRDGGTDHLRYFLSEARNGNMHFRTVEEVRFHFFQINGWYFELSKFTRGGYNRGWLISQLTRVTDTQKSLLEKYILRLM